ncbi:PREDICTED: uncharacterized protein LOC101295898 [Fragaria vesca subsp. vesca]|uniref:uncharacterized protein LOC101295898 n=1 Tax=Fragaria vesca subsp. vesca TaxID=101020 RepID=UPI0002C30D06|nr:PREDICTED: uncharacterized protein LOC101295898 [Fragaria vesca subsp. vesca]
MGKGKKKDKKLKLVEDSKSKHQVFLSWSCPRKGWYKLNVDGTAHKRIGGSGVIRDEHGQWVGGFSANFGKGKAIDAELLALLTGLEYAWSSGWYPLEVETDAIRAIMFMVNEVEVDYSHPQFDLVKRCQAVLKHNWTYNLRHVYREQNCVADSLAKHGRTLEPGCHYFTDPPPHCIPLLAEDQSGVARPRFITPKAMQYRTMTSQNPITGESKKIEVSLEKEDLASVTFRWKIDNFSELNLKHYSEVFIIGDFKWRVLMYPKGNNTNHLSVYLEVPDSSDLPIGWSRYAQFSLTMVNQVNHSKSFTKETVHVFSIHESEFGFQSLAPLILLRDQRNGFLVNDTCIIEAEVGVRKAEVKIMEDPSSSISAPMEALIIGEKQNEE